MIVQDGVEFDRINGTWFFDIEGEADDYGDGQFPRPLILSASISASRSTRPLPMIGIKVTY